MAESTPTSTPTPFQAPSKKDYILQISNLVELNSYWKQVHGSYLNDTQLELMSSIDDMFISCVAPGRLPCSASSFLYVFYPMNGQCYRYNSSDVELAGIDNSLVVDLFMGASDTQQAADPFIIKGIFAFVQNASEYPFYYAASPLMFAPGMTYVVSMSRTFYKQYNAWPFAYSDCGVLMEPLADSRHRLRLFTKGMHRGVLSDAARGRVRLPHLSRHVAGQLCRDCCPRRTLCGLVSTTTTSGCHRPAVSI